MKKYIFFLSIIFIIYFLTAAYNNADWDLWARLAVGKIFFTTGSVLKQDIFAYTHTKPLWIDHEWLSGVVFYFIVQKFGDLGLSLLKALLLFSVFLSVYKLNRLKFTEQNHYRIIYYAFFLYSVLFGFITTVQSHCFTFAFFALWMYVLELVRRGHNKLIWIFPATMAIWANLHGGFFAGLGLVFLYALGEALNRKNFVKYIIILALSSLATLLNPYGIKYLPYLMEAVTMQRPFLTEWMPIDIFGPFNIAFGFKVFGIFTLITLPYMLFKKYMGIKKALFSLSPPPCPPPQGGGKLLNEGGKAHLLTTPHNSNEAEYFNWAEILVLAATFYVSLQHIMHNVFFIIASAGYITGYFYEAINFYAGNAIQKFKSFFPEKFRHFAKCSREFAIYGLIITIGALTIHFVPLKVKVDNTRFPVKAVKFIEMNKLSGNLLVLFNWGSYALWKLYPQCRVAVDGRYDGVYPESLINETARFHYVGKNWDDLMTKYHADILLINTDYEVYKKLIHLEDWRIVYKDEASAVFIPMSKNKKHWIIPDENFNIDKEKFNTRILN